MQYLMSLVKYTGGKGEVISLRDVYTEDEDVITDFFEYCEGNLFIDGDKVGLDCFDGCYELFNFDFLLKVSKEGQEESLFVLSYKEEMFKTVAEHDKELCEYFERMQELIDTYEVLGMSTDRLKEVAENMEAYKVKQKESGTLDLIEKLAFVMEELKVIVNEVLTPEQIRGCANFEVRDKEDINIVLILLEGGIAPDTAD